VAAREEEGMRERCWGMRRRGEFFFCMVDKMMVQNWCKKLCGEKTTNEKEGTKGYEGGEEFMKGSSSKKKR